MNRRLFLGGIGAFLATPAIVRVGNLMPVRSIITPPAWKILYEGVPIDEVLSLARRQLIAYQFCNPLELPEGRLTYTATRYKRLPLPAVSLYEN